MHAVQLTGRPVSRSQVPSMLRVTRLPNRPPCGANDVLVRVLAASITPADLNPGYLSLNLGHGFSGLIEEVGAKVTEVKVGDKVLGLRHGCWGEYVSLAAAKVVQLPEYLSWAEGATLSVAGILAMQVMKIGGWAQLPRSNDIPKEDVELEADTEIQALLLKRGKATEQGNEARQARVCVVGAGTTIGRILVTMLASRRIKVVGVASKESAASVLKCGAVGVLDRTKNGGLGERGDLSFNKIIDCIVVHK